MTLSFFCAAALASACSADTVPESDPELADGQVHGDDGVDTEPGVPVAKTELATIDVGTGKVIYYVDDDGPEAGTITVLETSVPDASGGLRIRDAGDLSPLEMYLDLTEDSVPVPGALLTSLESDEALAQAQAREVVDILQDEIRSPVADGPQPAWSAAFMCAEGGTSAQFYNEICPADDDWTLNYCHNGTWYSVTDDTFTGHKSEWSRGRTLACYGNGRQRHRYKFWGVWYTPIDKPVPSGNMYRYTRKSSIGVKLRRQVIHSRTGSGFVRGATDFYRFPF